MIRGLPDMVDEENHGSQGSKPTVDYNALRSEALGDDSKATLSEGEKTELPEYDLEYRDVFLSGTLSWDLPTEPDERSAAEQRAYSTRLQRYSNPEGFQSLLDSLNDRERDVVCRRWGLLDHHMRFNRVIGEELDISTGRVTQIVHKSLSKVIAKVKGDQERLGLDHLDRPVNNFAQIGLSVELGNTLESKHLHHIEDVWKHVEEFGGLGDERARKYYFNDDPTLIAEFEAKYEQYQSLQAEAEIAPNTD